MDHLFENLCYKICGAAVEDFFYWTRVPGAVEWPIEYPVAKLT